MVRLLRRSNDTPEASKRQGFRDDNFVGVREIGAEGGGLGESRTQTVRRLEPLGGGCPSP